MRHCCKKQVLNHIYLHIHSFPSHQVIRDPKHIRPPNVSAATETLNDKTYNQIEGHGNDQQWDIRYDKAPSEYCRADAGRRTSSLCLDPNINKPLLGRSSGFCLDLLSSLTHVIIFLLRSKNCLLFFWSAGFHP